MGFLWGRGHIKENLNMVLDLMGSSNNLNYLYSSRKLSIFKLVNDAEDFDCMYLRVLQSQEFDNFLGYNLCYVYFTIILSFILRSDLRVPKSFDGYCSRRNSIIF